MDGIEAGRKAIQWEQMGGSVFRQLLSGDLDQVSGALRRFSDDPEAASGQLTVTHHPGRTARFFIWVLRLPRAGASQTTSIVVRRTATTEVWSRVIGESRFLTRHRARKGLLEEKAGLFRFLHKVEVREGTLIYRQERVYFLGIRLPRVFSPIVDAEAHGDENGWRLNLVVSCPRCGPICRYEGWVEPSWK